MVFLIFVDFTVPAMIRPRMDTLPVNGHFLSTYVPAHTMFKQPCPGSNRDDSPCDNGCCVTKREVSVPVEATMPRKILGGGAVELFKFSWKLLGSQPVFVARISVLHLSLIHI